jgi:hypothetical protein
VLIETAHVMPAIEPTLTIKPLFCFAIWGMTAFAIPSAANVFVLKTCFTLSRGMSIAAPIPSFSPPKITLQAILGGRTSTDTACVINHNVNAPPLIDDPLNYPLDILFARDI